MTIVSREQMEDALRQLGSFEVKPARIYLSAAQAADPKIVNGLRRLYRSATLYRIGKVGEQPEEIT